jgi:hypothetical protein
MSIEIGSIGDSQELPDAIEELVRPMAEACHEPRKR